MSHNDLPDALIPPDPNEQESLRALNRSPHPYHHQTQELPYASDRFENRSQTARFREPESTATRAPLERDTSFRKESSPGSESGTEADDEHFLKGLPAPKSRLHKGLRGREESSGTSTPLLSPAIIEEEGSHYVTPKKTAPKAKPERRRVIDLLRRHRNLAQRATEALIVAALGIMVRNNRQVSPMFKIWERDYQLMGLVYGTLLALYPLRVAIWGFRKRNPSRTIPLKIPKDFDPAPILYPPAITICVSLLIATDNPAVILPNIVLSICSWPQQVIPKFELNAAYDSIHWALTCIPLVLTASRQGAPRVASTHAFVSNEDMALLYPLHQTLCVVLHHLTTTSLLTAELQLFSIAMLNVLLLASSPQIQALKSLLWVGGLGLLVTCSGVIKAGIVLARVPKWRFRQIPGNRRRPLWKELSKVFSWRRIKSEFFSTPQDAILEESSTSDDDAQNPHFKAPKRVQTLGANFDPAASVGNGLAKPSSSSFQPKGLARSQTLSYVDGHPQTNPSHTPSGRRKRAVSISIRPFLKLTYTQAVIRKWLYALYVYSMLGVVILGGIRTHMQFVAFKGKDPIGWALGYLFGDWDWFRFQVVNANLERWICLPPRADEDELNKSYDSIVEELRHTYFGVSHTRLILAGYWIVVMIVGLITVFRLTNIYEVDTRRKVFHFMMVGMLLPSTFVDPAYIALALAIVLAIFLGLDLLRASQLPPLSKPIASFLAPYVDGRDFRGPVVISHIFLLIGCAIPLWLALAALPRTGSDYSIGWEIPTREVSMVSGVICVGLGDAAASLIGRRYGHRKWLWGGGKSLEGSLAFAVAVFVGLAASSVWLRVGGWPVAGDRAGVLQSARNAGVCASMASLCEAVLTGGNDNVIVPVVLWTCVKSLAI